MKVRYTDGKDPDFVALCKQLDNYLTNAVDLPSEQKIYDQYNTLTDIHDAFVAYCDEVPAGCVSFKAHSEHVAEVKRMFVVAERRGQGVSGLLLSALEEKAIEKGYSSLILETGTHLEAAQSFYRKAGFSIIPNYGQYENMPQSVCMEKKLPRRPKSP